MGAPSKDQPQVPSIYFRPVDGPAMFGLSRSTLYRWAKDGRIGIRKVGGASLMKTAEVVAIIESDVG